MDSEASATTRYTANDSSQLQRYAALALICTGGLEWFLGRTVSRVAAAPNLEGTPRDIIDVLGRIGLYMVSPSFLLALLILWLAVVQAGGNVLRRGARAGVALPLFLAVLGTVAAVHTFYPTLLWLNIAFNLMALLALWWLALHAALRGSSSRPMKAALVLAALAYTGWFYYVLQSDLVNSHLVTLPAPLLLLNLGEMAAVCVPFALFWAVAIPYGQWRYWRRWIAPGVVGLLFAGGNIADAIFDQGFTGVFTIWSVGLNLFLPWPLYAVSLVLFTYVVLTCFSRRGERSPEANPNVGMGTLLLMFAGYALQVPYQIVLAMLSFMLLSGIAHPFAATQGVGVDEGRKVGGMLLRRRVHRIRT